MVTAGGVVIQGSTARWASSAVNAAKLAEQLALASAKSPFSPSGGLTEDTIANSRQIIRPEKLANPDVPNGYGKYSSQTFRSPSGEFQVHFYRNPSTGQVYYGLDYKAVFNQGIGFGGIRR